MKINLDDYAVQDMEIDEQRSFNHINCPAGEDRKQRLYVKRIDNGLLYYCHHCSARGIQPKNGKRIKPPENPFDGQSPQFERSSKTQPNDNAGVSQATPRLYLPEDSDQNTSSWPRRARGWVLKYITTEEVKNYGICYSPTTRRVHIPYAGDNGICVIQARKIFPEDEKPKYLTVRNNGSRVVLGTGSVCGNILVITEDIISAIKCARYTSAYPLLSSSLDIVGLTTIIKGGFNKIFIWLDDDNHQVKKSQRDLKNLLELCTDAVVEVIHTKGKDPKEHTIEEIKEILKLSEDK